METTIVKFETENTVRTATPNSNCLERLFSQVLTSLGENPNRDGLRQTPARVARSLSFLTAGYWEDPSEVVNGAVFESDSDEMVIVRNIEFYSLCEHHLLPFFGKCHIAYLPDG